MSSRLVLIVDDDQDFRKLARTALEARGLAVEEAAGLAQGRALLDALSPAVLVLDSNLPDGDGLKWLESVRWAGRRTPTLVVSAGTFDARDLQRALRDPSTTSVIEKPVPAAVLVEQVEQLLDLEKSGPRDRSQLASLKADYLKVLPERIEALEAAVRAASARPGDVATVERARMLAHRLHGTSGSYGLLAVAEGARALGSALRAGPSDPQWAKLDELTTSARLSARAASERAPDDAAVPSESITRVGWLGTELPASAGLRVKLVSCESIETLVAAAREAPFDCAVIDLDLGPEVAPDAARALRALPTMESLPIAAVISGHSSLATRASAVHAGASLILEKPVAAPVLGSAITQLLGAGRAFTPHVVIVEDDPDLGRTLWALLRRAGCAVTLLSSGERLQKVLSSQRTDLIVLDVQLAGVGGLALCQMLRATPEFSEVPVMFLTATNTAQTRIAAFRAGADYFLVKPVPPEELLARVQARLERSRWLRIRKDHDALTGLLLRGAFVTQGRALLRRALQNQTPVTVAIIDVDHFKKVNDTWGHVMGDRVLSAVGAILQRRFRNEDLRCRWGGEEFVLAFAGERLDSIAQALAHTREELEGHRFEAEGGDSFTVSFSAGLAIAPNDGNELERLVDAADRWLYEAKRGGRRRTEWAGAPK